MIEKLKNKIEQIDEKRMKTESNQKILINSSSIFNEKIKLFVENDNLEKNSYDEGKIKIKNINQRIQECTNGINKIKEKLKYINTRLINKAEFSHIKIE